MTEISTPNYAVKQVRGPFVELPDHPGHTASEKELVALCNDLRSHGVPLAADLFSGGAGGGMSLGLEDAGFRVVLGVDHYRFAVETHRHHFAGMSVEEDMADPETIQRVAKILKRNKVDLLAGGPPMSAILASGSLNDPSSGDDRRSRSTRRTSRFVAVVLGGSAAGSTAGCDDGERSRYGAGPRDVHLAQHDRRA